MSLRNSFKLHLGSFFACSSRKTLFTRWAWRSGMAPVSHRSSLASWSLHMHADIINHVCGHNSGGGLLEKTKRGGGGGSNFIQEQ